MPFSSCDNKKLAGRVIKPSSFLRRSRPASEVGESINSKIKN